MSAPQEGHISSTPKPKVKISELVDNALKSLNERSGSSLIAIKKFIANTNGEDSTKNLHLIKKYIKASLESGKFIQTKGTGLNGSFKLSKEALKEPKKPKPKKAKVDSDGEAKPMKITLKKSKKALYDGEEVKKQKPKKDGITKKASEKKEAAPKKDKLTKKKIVEKKDAVPKKAAPVKKSDLPSKKATKKQDQKSLQETNHTNDIPDEVAKSTASSPMMKKGKENAPPPKEKQVKKKLPSIEDEQDSEDDGPEAPELKVRDLESLNKLAEEIESTEKHESDSEGLSEPEEDPNIAEESADSDRSVSSEESPKKPPVKTKGKAAAKPIKKRKSIATLANPVKAKVSKK